MNNILEIPQVVEEKLIISERYSKSICDQIRVTSDIFLELDTLSTPGKSECGVHA